MYKKPFAILLTFLFIAIIATPVLAQSYNPADSISDYYTKTIKPIANVIFKTAIIMGLVAVVGMVVIPGENHSLKKGVQIMLIACVAITIVSGIVTWVNSVSF